MTTKTTTTTTEVWKDIPGYEGYKVSSQGRVYCHLQGHGRKKGGLFIKPQNWNGYQKLKLTSSDGVVKNFKVHRLVALVFIPNPLKLGEVNHINGVKGDNRVENLEWVSHRENMIHAAKTNLLTKGEARPNSKLKEFEVREIRAAFDSGLFSSRQIASSYGICSRTARKIRDREKWQSVT